MVARPDRLRMSVEEYLTLDRNSTETRYEYIDGYAYALAGGTADHARISANLIGELRDALRGGPCSFFTSDVKVRISETRYVYPDVTVSCDPRDRGTVDILQSPHLIVEVLSPSTEAGDRGAKFADYRACPIIEEYVLVNTQRQAVEVYQREQEPFWRYTSFGPDDKIELTSLGISFPVSAVYEDVVVP